MVWLFAFICTYCLGSVKSISLDTGCHLYIITHHLDFYGDVKRALTNVKAMCKSPAKLTSTTVDEFGNDIENDIVTVMKELQKIDNQIVLVLFLCYFEDQLQLFRDNIALHHITI